MIKKLLFVLVLLGFSFGMYAQNIVVVDMETSFPIGNVRVQSPDGKYLFYTNIDGIINIRNFRKRDTIIFKHPDYDDFVTTKRDIIHNKYVVELVKHYQKLDNVILSVTRTKNKKSKIAKQVKVVDRTEMLKLIPANAAAMLESAGNIAVQKTQGGAGSPIIRGMEANRVLLVMDGVRLNNAISRSGHLHTAISINPLVLERTEIIYGPSAIYGSDALGGVIHFYTRTPIVNNYKKLSGGAIAQFATANNETTFHFNTALSYQKWATEFAYSYSDFGNIRMGKNRVHGYKDWGITHLYSQNSENFYTDKETENPDQELQPNTGYSQKDFFNKTVVMLGKKNELIFDTQLNLNSAIDRFDKLSEYKSGHLKFAEWRYGPSKRLLFSPRLLLHFDSKWLKKARIILAYQDHEESRISRKYTSMDRKYQKENVKVYSFNADLNTQFGKHRVLSYGLEGNYNTVKSEAYSKTLKVNGNDIIALVDSDPVPTRYPDGGSTYASFAAYANYRYDLNRKSSFKGGVRFTQTYITVAWKDNTFITLPYNINKLANFAFTGDLSYIFTPKNWKMNVVLSSGFRSPNVDDIGKIREKRGKVTVPNIFLKPEYAYNSELGITRFFNHKKFSISADAFYSYLYNFIARDRFELQPGMSQILYNGEWADTYANVNAGDAEIYGGSLVLDGKINKHIKISVGAFYTKGRMLDEQRPLPSIPPLYGHMNLGYKYNNIETSLQFNFMMNKPVDEYDVVGGKDNLDESPLDPVTGEYVGFPQWQVLNWYGTYHINKSFSLNLGVDNILDINYRTFASSVGAPGRNFKIQIATHF